MKIILTYTCLLSQLIITTSCGSTQQEEKKAANAGKKESVATTDQQVVDLPAPYATESADGYCKVIGWPAGKLPIAPKGFIVAKFADSLNNPRWIYVAKSGDIFVAEANTEVSALKKLGAKITGKGKSQNLGNPENRITLFRDTDGDGQYDFRSVFLEHLNRPFGMLIIGKSFYVGNTDAVMQFAYEPGADKIASTGKKIVSLPAGGYNNHWTRNLVTNSDSSKIFISVGSGSNVAEHGLANEIRRADILEVNPDGSNEKIYASGLRNPVGMSWAPGTNVLWTAVNERDELGDELVPDYMTSVKEGGFYGWPYSYYGQHEDPRMKDKQNPEMVKKAVVPDVSLGAHTASLGLAFDTENAFPGQFKGAAFIGQHGSWNRSTLSGYKVVTVPFHNGKPAGKPQDFLTGFMTGKEKEVYGRPVCVAFTKQGRLLVADDASNTIWIVSSTK